MSMLSLLQLLWSLRNPHGKAFYDSTESDSGEVEIAGRTEHELQFCWFLQDLLENQCELLTCYERYGYDDFVLFSPDSPVSSHEEPFGIVDHNRLFLRSDTVFRLAKKEHICCRDSSKESYFAHMVLCGLIIPSFHIFSPIEFILRIDGKREKYICVSNWVLDVNLLNLPGH